MTNPKDEMISIMLGLNKRKRTNIPKYQKPTIFDKFGGVCAYCGDALNGSKKNAWGVTHAIPLHLGGESSADNRIPSCIPCIQRYGTADCLSALTDNETVLTPTWHAKLTAMRDAALLRARNHLTPLSPKSDIELVRKNVQGRWIHERTTVFATVLPTHVVFGLTDRSGSNKRVAEMASLLVFGFKAQRLGNDGDYEVPAAKAGLNLFVVPRDRLLAATMALTEENCWLREVRVSITPEHTNSEWRSYWFRSYAALKDNLKRRVYGEAQAPWHIKNTLSMSAGAVRARRHYNSKRAKTLARMEQHAQVMDLRVAAGQPLEDWDERVKRGERQLQLQLKLS